MPDIRFYDLDFNLLRILPPNSKDIGFKAINTQQDFNGSGSVEILFRDDILKELVKQYRDNMIIVWRDFQGLLTSYKFNQKESHLYGTHLNGLLHRAVIPICAERTDTVANFTRSALDNISWLSFNDNGIASSSVTYSTDKPNTADNYLQNLFKLGGCGYEIKADFENKKYIFKLIESKQNSLMLSETNLNAYNFETTYTGKELAFGGWYKNETDDKWTYIVLNDTKSGIHKIDTVLSATTLNEAMNELKQKKSEYTITLNTKRIECGKDYKIGDIVRIQEDGITQQKLVSSVMKWEENGYGEKPVLTDYEEVST